MKSNYALALVGSEVTLVPYRKHHVEKYHEWMCSQELLEATASEPLSLKEEYEMQKSWRDDEKKCTFILLRGGQNGVEEGHDEGARMLGDVNLFLNDYDDPCNAEIEIMVAESGHRRKGYARGPEADDGLRHGGTHYRFYAKIAQTLCQLLLGPWALYKSTTWRHLKSMVRFRLPAEGGGRDVRSPSLTHRHQCCAKNTSHCRQRSRSGRRKIRSETV